MEIQKKAPLIQLAVGGALGLLIVFLGVEVWAQQEQLQSFERQLARMDVTRPATAKGAARAPDLEMTRRVRALEAEVARLRRARGGTAAPLQVKGPDGEPVVVAAAPVPVVAGHVLGTLESEDPAVQERVRKVMRRELSALRQERRESRWSKRQERATKRFEAMASRANLTQDQVETLEPAMLEERDQIRTIFRDARQNQEFGKAREKVTAVRAETDAEARETLDEDQYKEYEKMRAEEAERWNRRGGRRGPPPAPTTPTKP